MGGNDFSTTRTQRKLIHRDNPFQKKNNTHIYAAIAYYTVRVITTFRIFIDSLLSNF